MFRGKGKVKYFLREINEEKVAKNENFSHPERCTICGGEVWAIVYGELTYEAPSSGQANRCGWQFVFYRIQEKSGNENLNPKLAHLGQSLYFYNKMGIKGEMA